MNDETIKRSSELLLQGATMLQIACPQCSNPIFKLRDGTMHCAHCNQQVFHERDIDPNMQKKLDEADSPVKKKIDVLTKQLEQEEDPDKIIKLAETIKKLKDIL